MVLMTLYADDLHVTKPIKDAHDNVSVQEDITAIANHIEKLHLAPQSGSVFWGQEKDGFSLFKNMNELQVECYCYLGVIYSEPTHLMVRTHPTSM